MSIIILSGSGKVREKWELAPPSVHKDRENDFLERGNKKKSTERKKYRREREDQLRSIQKWVNFRNQQAGVKGLEYLHRESVRINIQWLYLKPLWGFTCVLMFKGNIIASYLQIKTPILEKTNAVSKNRVDKQESLNLTTILLDCSNGNPSFVYSWESFILS